MICQFTEHTSAIKVRGEALIQTANGEMKSESKNSRLAFMPVRVA